MSGQRKGYCPLYAKHLHGHSRRMRLERRLLIGIPDEVRTRDSSAARTCQGRGRSRAKIRCAGPPTPSPCRRDRSMQTPSHPDDRTEVERFLATLPDCDRVAVDEDGGQAEAEPEPS